MTKVETENLEPIAPLCEIRFLCVACGDGAGGPYPLAIGLDAAGTPVRLLLDCVLLTDEA